MKCCLSALQSDLEKTTGAVRSATGVWSDEQMQTKRLSQSGGPQPAFSCNSYHKNRERVMSPYRFSDLSSGDARTQEGEILHKQEPEQPCTVAVSHAV